MQVIHYVHKLHLLATVDEEGMVLALPHREWEEKRRRPFHYIPPSHTNIHGGQTCPGCSLWSLQLSDTTQDITVYDDPDSYYGRKINESDKSFSNENYRVNYQG